MPPIDPAKNGCTWPEQFARSLESEASVQQVAHDDRERRLGLAVHWLNIRRDVIRCIVFIIDGAQDFEIEADRS